MALYQRVPAAVAVYKSGGSKSAYLDELSLTLSDKVQMLPRVLPFVIRLIGVMVALYGGYATPSETAGLAESGSDADRDHHGVWRPADVSPILKSTLKESTMPTLKIGM